MDNPHAGHNMAGDSDAPPGGMMHDMDMDMNMGMAMYFHISDKATILFKSWTTTSWQGMLASCVAVFVMALLYEGMKVARQYLLHKYSDVPQSCQTNGKTEKPTCCDTEVETMIEPHHTKTKSMGSRMCALSHLIQTVLHVCQLSLSYLLMLIFMTYNFYLCAAVVLGAGAGYFLFGWKRTSIIDVNEHCH